MQLTNTVLGLAAVAATSASAQQGSTIKVTVGEGGALQYNPANLKAEVGTAIEFDFFPKNHSVTQSSFANPCHPLEGGFFSSFVPTKNSPSGTSFTITVNDTKPIWFYCGQGNHCQSGMVGAINAPTSGNTFEAFGALAKKADKSTSPPGGAAGGVLKGTNSSSSISSSVSAIASASSGSGSGSGSGSNSTSVAQSSSAYTTSAYTSTWTSNGATFTTTATTTLFTAVPAPTAASSSSTTSVSKGAAPTGLSRFNALNAGALIVAAAAML